MIRYRLHFLFLAVFLSCVPCYAHHLAVVVNNSNHVDAMTSAELGKIFKTETRHWSGGNDIVVILSRNSAMTQQVLQRLWKMSAAEAKEFVATHKNSILWVDSDAQLIHLIETTPGAVGLVDVRSITKTVSVLKVDGKLPLEDGYLPH